MDPFHIGDRMEGVERHREYHLIDYEGLYEDASKGLFITRRCSFFTAMMSRNPELLEMLWISIYDQPGFGGKRVGTSLRQKFHDLYHEIREDENAGEKLWVAACVLHAQMGEKHPCESNRRPVQVLITLAAKMPVPILPNFLSPPVAPRIHPTLCALPKNRLQATWFVP